MIRILQLVCSCLSFHQAVVADVHFRSFWEIVWLGLTSSAGLFCFVLFCFIDHSTHVQKPKLNPYFRYNFSLSISSGATVPAILPSYFPDMQYRVDDVELWRCTSVGW